MKGGILGVKQVARQLTKTDLIHAFRIVPDTYVALAIVVIVNDPQTVLKEL